MNAVAGKKATDAITLQSRTWSLSRPGNQFIVRVVEQLSTRTSISDVILGSLGSSGVMSWRLALGLLLGGGSWCSISG